MFESRGPGWLIQHGVVALLGFGRRDTIGSSCRRLLNQSTHSSAANSTASHEVGFKRSSQHLNEGGCGEHSKAPITLFWTGAAAFTGTAASSGAI